MYKIGFHNFRRFKEFEPIEYKGITFLVGRNNSGKSTLVKALLLINEFLKSGQIKTFSFGNNILEDANIVTYNRAKNNSSQNEDFIIFSYQLFEHLFEVMITGDQNTTEGRVISIIIIDSKRSIYFNFNALNSTIKIAKQKNETGEYPSSGNSVLAELDKQIKAMEKIFEIGKFKKSSKVYISFVDELSTLKEKRNRAAHFVNEQPDSEPYSVETSFVGGLNIEEILESAISKVLALHDLDFRKIQEGEDPSKDFPNYRGFKFDLPLIEESFNACAFHVTNQSILYLGANPSKQSALFAIRDKNNALAQAIHNFAPTKDNKEDEAYRFATSWMKKFNVGESFTIELHAGEAYEVVVHTNGNSVQLADMGMGSIQVMLLILRLASIIRKVNDLYTHNTLVIIEEPELNLHPALQSQLADLFLEVHEKYKINFIIETHSEYLLRETQFLVKEKEFEIEPNENPFCVIYFDLDKLWKMNYRSDGKFIEEFGTGFYDQTRKTVRKTL